MSRPKSNRRFEVLAVIESNPRISVRELCEATGIKSTSNIWRYLHELEAEGRITRKPGARGIFIGERPWGSEVGRKRNGVCASRDLVLDAFRKDPRASLDELAAATGLCRTTVHHHLTLLERDGFIKMNHDRGNRTGQYHFKLSHEQVSEIRKKAAQKRIHTNKKYRNDSLETRIEMVVQRAKTREGGGMDVVRDEHVICLSGLRASRLG